MNRHIPIFSVLLLILSGCVTTPISPEFSGRSDDIDREERNLGRENSNQPDEQFKRQITEETELDRALQRLVDDLELAVMGLSDREPNDQAGPGGEHLVKEGEYLDLIIEKTMPKFCSGNPGAKFSKEIEILKFQCFLQKVLNYTL